MSVKAQPWRCIRHLINLLYTKPKAWTCGQNVSVCAFTVYVYELINVFASVRTSRFSVQHSGAFYQTFSFYVILFTCSTMKTEYMFLLSFCLFIFTSETSLDPWSYFIHPETLSFTLPACVHHPPLRYLHLFISPSRPSSPPLVLPTFSFHPFLLLLCLSPFYQRPYWSPCVSLTSALLSLPLAAGCKLLLITSICINNLQSTQ